MTTEQDNHQEKKKSDRKEMPLMSHLIELRSRLLKIILVSLVVFIGLFFFRNELYLAIQSLIEPYLEKGVDSVSARDSFTFFFSTIKLTFVASLFIVMPYILHHIWAFIAPALYSNEKRLARPLLISSILLFYLGQLFAYFVVLPLIFKFLVSILSIPLDQDPVPLIDLVIKFFFAFGFAFEIPVATILLIWSGIITAEDLKKKRPYVIVSIFVIAMLLTPPDPFSQSFLAIPMWLLFELGIVLSSILKKHAKKEDLNNDESKI